MEIGSGGGDGGGGSGSGSGGAHQNETAETERKKKKYHRHTAHQIQRLEETFKECPHPDEKQRLQLSQELDLAPRQIKFWFQNRRTQMKAQHERADNCALRAENDKIRCENIAIREALKNAICPNCGGPPVEDPYFGEQKLRIENAHLREELERVSSITGKYIGRPLYQLPPIQPMHISPLDLSMASLGCGPSLDFDLLPGSSTTAPNISSQANLVISDMDKSLMTDTAVSAMQELLRLLQTDEPMWTNNSCGRDVLNLENYESMFPRATNHGKNHNVRNEASRCSDVVSMSGLTLVDIFMDSNKWLELFPTLVSAAKTLAIVSPGIAGTHSGSLQLMYEEVQVLSPLVATREFCVLRHCQQIEPGTWAIVNISYDFPQLAFRSRSYRLPSGCLIQETPNGYTKVTWVEHVEIDDKEPTHQFCRDLIHSGMAFGAERWVATLQRMCERFACLLESGTSAHDLRGVIPSPGGTRSITRLAQRMVSHFCTNVGTSNHNQASVVSGLNELGVRVTAHKSHEPNGTVLSAATTFWLPISPQNVFNFFKDERTRPQWDVLSNGNAVQEVAQIPNGSRPGNCISVLRAFNVTQNNNMLILQESCIDSSGSLVVYSPVDVPGLNIVMSGEDPSFIPLLPSGFAISPDGWMDQGSDEASTSTGRPSGGGSLITVAFQIMVSTLPSAKLNMESVSTVNNLISTTVHQIKTALNCPTP